MRAERDGVALGTVCRAGIREATPDDLASMLRVESAARGQLAAVGIDLAGLDVGEFHEDLAWDMAMVAEVDGELVGLVRATTDQDRVIVDQLSVDPAWGRQGIGTHLLEHLAMAAANRGFQRLVGTTFVSVTFNAPFYQRLGATIVPDVVLGQRRGVEHAIGLDHLGERVVVSFELAPMTGAIQPANALPSRQL